MKIKVAAISMTSTPNSEANVKEAERLVRLAHAQGCSWICLPEMLAYMGPYGKIWDHADDGSGEIYSRFSRLAKELAIVLFAGTWAEKPSPKNSSEQNQNQNQNQNLLATQLSPKEQGSQAKDDNSVENIRKAYNSLHVFGRDGSLLCRYRKVHLFSLRSESGEKTHSEPDGYLAGHEFKSVIIDGLRVHLAICYDLRFPEMFMAMQKQGLCDVLVAPSAFTKATGERHWELLCRSRAIDLQAWVIAPNQVGVHYDQKESFGHSMIVDPWGNKMADSGDEPGIAIHEIDTDRIATYRARLPVLSNKRFDLY